MNWCRVLVKVSVPVLGERGRVQYCSATVTHRLWVWVWKGTGTLFAFSDAATAVLSCLFSFQHVVWLLCQLRHVILLGFLHIRADVNTLTHEKYVPQSFYVLVVRVRKIVIITRNCTWVDALLHALRGPSLLLVLEIRFCLLPFFFFLSVFLPSCYLLPKIDGAVDYRKGKWELSKEGML